MQKLSTTAGQPSAGFLLPRTDTGKELPTFQAPKITMGICRQIAAQLGVVHPGELPKLYRPANGGIPSTSLLSEVNLILIFLRPVMCTTEGATPACSTVRKNAERP